MWSPPEFNKKFKPVQPDDRRGFYQTPSSKRIAGLRGVVHDEKSERKALLWGRIALSLTSLIYLMVAAFFVLNFLSFEGEAVFSGLGCGICLSVIILHFIVLGGESALGRVLPYGGLALKLIWFPPAFILIVAIVFGVIQKFLL